MNEPIDLYIHVGHEKCGSSTLQDLCAQNPEEFKAKNYYLPESPNPNKSSPNTRLPIQWKNGNIGLKAYVEACRKKGFKKIFLTSEFFVAYSEDIPRNTLFEITDYLKKNSVRLHLLCIYRPAQQYSKSKYKQIMLNRPQNNMKFHDLFYEKMLWRDFDPLERIKRLYSFLSPESFLCLKLSDDWLDRAINFIGLDPTKVIWPEKRNVSIPDVYTEIMRQLNGLIPDEKGSLEFRALMNEVTRHQNNNLERNARKIEEYSTLNEDILSKLTYTENSPLQYSQEEFADAKLKIIQTLNKLKTSNNTTAAQRISSN